jgi:hypothetical protein
MSRKTLRRIGAPSADLFLMSAHGAWAGGPPPSIPTLSEWSMLGFAMLLAIFGVITLVRQTRRKRDADRQRPSVNISPR